MTFELITSIFDNLELRGIDASGVWGTEIGGKKARVIYHKEPVRSSLFVKGTFWKRLRKVKTDMLLVHSRATSRGGGHASSNANNHPFVSRDKRIGMVHNGTIEEAKFIVNKYQTSTDTDSECLLRIFEHGMDRDFETFDGVPDDVSSRLTGIKEMWSYISSGAMAVALGERVGEHGRRLFLFRNEKRPLWIIDLRDLLGQIFFVSSPDIWYRAIDSSYELAAQCWSAQKLIELPPHHVWHLGIGEEDTVVTDNNVFKFKLDARPTINEFTAGEFKKIKPPMENINVITPLDENDELPSAEDKTSTIRVSVRKSKDDRPIWPDDESNDGSDWNQGVCRTDHESLCAKIGDLANDIDALASNLCMEGSMLANDYDQLIESLEQTRCDLEGTFKILGG